ncbi:MAG: hypothetical protein IJ217_00960 [Clostridia bacterium]|nr:hypothetical protein [Clostridia bacterium]
MDSQMMLQMLSGMLDKMSDKELESTLQQVKTLVSPQDYAKINELIAEKRQKR